jgi:hypothetical protein
MEQRVSDTENRRNGESEIQKIRDLDGTHASHEAALATPVRTLPEAVELSFNGAPGEDVLFRFARALKAFEVSADVRMNAPELEIAFAEWWRTAKPRAKVPPDADFDECRLLFLDAFDKARAPLGANPLKQAIERADKMSPPPEADRYPSQRLKRLVSVCYQLQLLAGEAPFFISVRDAAFVLGITKLQTVSAYLAGLVRDGILREVEKGKLEGRKATRFKYVRAGEVSKAGAKGARQPTTPVKPSPAAASALTPSPAGAECWKQPQRARSKTTPDLPPGRLTRGSA